MKRSIRFILIYILSFQGALQAQDANKSPLHLSLKEAIETALTNNTSIKNSKIDIEIAKKKIWETTAIGLPQVSGAISYQHLFKVPEVNFGGAPYLRIDDGIVNGTSLTADMIRNEKINLDYDAGMPIKLGLPNSTNFDVTLSQLIFNGSYLVGLQASKTYALIAQQSLEKVKYDLKETVTNTYFLALALKENNQILKGNLESINKTLFELKEMNKQGFVDITDVDQIELTGTNLEIAVKALERQVENVETLLKMQMNIPFSTPVLLTDKLEGFIGSVNLFDALNQKQDVKQNIEYKILENSEQAAKLGLKLELSGYLPSLAGYYRHTEKLKVPVFDMMPKDVAGISVNVPIFSSGQRAVKVQQRKMELEKVQNTKNLVEQSLNMALKTALNDLVSANEKYMNEQKQVALAKRIYDKTLIKFKEGIAGSMDVTNAHTQYLTSQNNYFTAILNVLQAKTKVDKISGNL